MRDSDSLIGQGARSFFAPRRARACAGRSARQRRWSRSPSSNASRCERGRSWPPAAARTRAARFDARARAERVLRRCSGSRPTARSARDASWSSHDRRRSTPAANTWSRARVTIGEEGAWSVRSAVRAPGSNCAATSTTSAARARRSTRPRASRARRKPQEEAARDAIVMAVRAAYLRLARAARAARDRRAGRGGRGKRRSQRVQALIGEGARPKPSCRSRAPTSCSPHSSSSARAARCARRELALEQAVGRAAERHAPSPTARCSRGRARRRRQRHGRNRRRRADAARTCRAAPRRRGRSRSARSGTTGRCLSGAAAAGCARQDKRSSRRTAPA